MHEFIENINKDNYLFGYSTDRNIDSVNIWQTSIDFSTIPNGEYWFFALNKYTKSEYYAFFEKIEQEDNICSIKIVSGIPINSKNCEIKINLPILIKDVKKGKAIIGKFK